MKLTHHTARRILDAAIAKAEQIEQPMNIAIVDDGARLVAFVRMDGAILASIDIAQKKAFTAMALKTDTMDLGPLTQPGQELWGIEHTNGGLVTFGGGVVLRDEKGEAIGAIGVSAGSVEQDVSVAKAGAAAL